MKFFSKFQPQLQTPNYLNNYSLQILPKKTFSFQKNHKNYPYAPKIPLYLPFPNLLPTLFHYCFQ